MIYTFKEFLNETDGPHSYGCVMAYFDYPEWNKLTGIIDPNDLAEDGIETESHVTLLYGLHNDIDHAAVIDLIKSFPNVAVELKNISIFENENFDVVKFDIDNEMLSNLNEQLKQFPYTNNFPKYSAHMTISYVKPGMGKKYISEIEPINVTSDYYVYSLADDEKIKI